MSTLNNSTDTFQKSDGLQKKSVEFKGKMIKGIYYNDQELWDALYTSHLEVGDHIGFFKAVFTDTVEKYRDKIFKLKNDLKENYQLRSDVRKEINYGQWLFEEGANTEEGKKAIAARLEYNKKEAERPASGNDGPDEYDSPSTLPGCPIGSPY